MLGGMLGGLVSAGFVLIVIFQWGEQIQILPREFTAFGLYLLIPGGLIVGALVGALSNKIIK